MIEMLTVLNNGSDATAPVLSNMLTVEDGTGVVGANSYAGYTIADEYAALRQIDAWSDATPAQKASALVRAADYMEATYVTTDARLNALQGLSFPIVGAAFVPLPVVTANILLAIEALKGPLVPARAERGVKSTKEALEGVGSTETVYDDAQGTSDPFPIITAMLAGVATLRGAASPSVWVGRVVK